VPKPPCLALQGVFINNRRS